METNTISSLLDERSSRYGTFVSHAKISQDLKKIVRNGLFEKRLKSRGVTLSGNQLKNLEDDQQEALEMICHKIARIVNGDANYADSWIDIAGYAKLVADRLAPNEQERL